MSLAILKLRNKPPMIIVSKANAIVTAMTGNAGFPTPSPSLVTITAKSDALKDAFEAAIDGGKTLKALVKIAKTDLIFNLSLLMSYVQVTSGGIEARILSAGFDVKSPSTPAGILPSPQNVRAEYTGNSGEVRVRWDAVPKRRSYIVQMSIDPIGPDTWENVPAGETGQRFLIVSDLTPGTKYWFRVIAYGTAGYSAPSDPALIMAA